MEKLLSLFSQRRVWAALVGGVAFLAQLLHFQFEFDVPMLTDLLTGFGGAIANLVAAGLALWSFLKPKKDLNPNPPLDGSPNNA